MADPVFPDPAPRAYEHTKESTNYRYAGNEDEDRCENCTHFIAGARNMNQCHEVFGLVQPIYTCNLFSKREMG